MLGIVTNASVARAAHYRERAASLREMANSDAGSLRSDLLELAGKYECLADTVSREWPRL
jgi:hypothetical protein